MAHAGVLLSDLIPPVSGNGGRLPLTDQHGGTCACVLCNACAERLSVYRAKRLAHARKAVGEILPSPESTSDTQSTSILREQSVARIQKDKVQHSHELRREKTALLPDGTVLTEIEREIKTQTHTTKLELRLVVSVQTVSTSTRNRTETFKKAYMENMTSCDSYNPHSLVVMQAYLETLVPMIPVDQIPAAYVDDPSLSEPEQMQSRREHNNALNREIDRNRLLHLDRARTIGQLQRQMRECTEALSGSKEALASRHLNENPFALHLRALRDAETDEARCKISPVYMRALEDMVPPQLLCVGQDQDRINKIFEALRKRRDLGCHADASAPYAHNKLVIPAGAFATPLAPATLALLVRQMLRSNHDVSRQLTSLVRERLHANGVMTRSDILTALRSFAESLILHAQANIVDANTISMTWENAERLLLDTQHFFCEYVPIHGSSTSVVIGLKLRRDSSNQIIEFMDQIFANWRTLASLEQFSMVGRSTSSYSESIILFDSACSTEDIEDPCGLDDADPCYMKDMPLRVVFPGEQWNDRENGAQ